MWRGMERQLVRRNSEARLISIFFSPFLAVAGLSKGKELELRGEGEGDKTA